MKVAYSLFLIVIFSTFAHAYPGNGSAECENTKFSVSVGQLFNDGTAIAHVLPLPAGESKANVYQVKINIEAGPENVRSAEIVDIKTNGRIFKLTIPAKEYDQDPSRSSVLHNGKAQFEGITNEGQHIVIKNLTCWVTP